MSKKSSYICECCGKRHEDWPSLAFTAPDNYNLLSQEDKDTIAELTSDFCVINYPDQTDRFIRVVLVQKVIDHCDDLHYGLWVSLSSKSFKEYSNNFDNETHNTRYFGWLSNCLAPYEFNEFIPTTVVTQLNNLRPEIFPHKDFDHPFVYDYYNGITKAEAEKRIKGMLEVTGSRKPWWKFN